MLMQAGWAQTTHMPGTAEFLANKSASRFQGSEQYRRWNPPPPIHSSHPPSNLISAMSDSPRGYLDIHGHFGVPLGEEELRKQLESFWKVDFMVNEPWVWTAEGILPYLDKANVTMQMLSYIPKSLQGLRQANDYGASIVSKFPTRFGLLLALPIGNYEFTFLFLFFPGCVQMCVTTKTATVLLYTFLMKSLS